ncbi:hypothetical protein AVEN_248423-1 [Araneus ventricosus]|uniref:Uncharacterized protein n=1 Tax=Araneus ventricosus TaxID=182803 RepID=A0A4Y2BF10_ARAVE|nr:hypothetical protein AVEN_248423-1 [Araneus ventricosus]
MPRTTILGGIKVVKYPSISPMDTFSEDFNISVKSLSLLLLAVGAATGGKEVIDATGDTFQGHYSGKVCMDLLMDDFSEDLCISVKSVHVSFLL